MPTFTEVLPAQKSSKNNAMNFTPTEFGGVLEVHTARASAVYHVSILPVAWDARAFRFEKIEGGTDAEARNYDVVCAKHHSTCECRGYLARHSDCKHISAAKALIGNGWL